MRYRTACNGTMLVPQRAQDHLQAHPEVWRHLPKAIGRVTLPTDNQFLAVAVDMGRVIGQSGCVKTPPISLNDQTLFAQRVNRLKPSRVIIGAHGVNTTKIVVLAFPAKEDQRTYVLFTSFVGELAPKEPWDPSIASEAERQESLTFWKNHALIFDPAVMGPPINSSWHLILESSLEPRR